MLEELRKKLEEVCRKMKDLNNKTTVDGKVRSFTEAEQSEYDALKKERDEINSAIQRAQDLEKDESTLRDLNSHSNKAPNLQVVREDDHNEDGEYRGYAPIERGGFGDFLKDVADAARGRSVSDRFKKLRAATGSNEAVGYTGGSLVQSDHAETLFSNMVDSSPILSRCTPYELNSNNFSINLVDETSIAIGSQFGGVRAYWRKEGSAVTPTKPKFRVASGKLGSLEALYYATDEQIEDAAQLASFAAEAFPATMVYQLVDAIFFGDGASQPLGIVNSPAKISIAKEGGQAAGSLLYANLDKMVDRLLVGAEEGAVIYIHPSLRQKLRNVFHVPGTLTEYMPFLINGGGKAGQERDPINGFPIERLQQCKAPGTEGDIILANLKHYYLMRKKGIKASESMHVAFLTGEQVFRWTQRAHGMPFYSQPITDANGSDTRAPFVTLATRA